VRVDLPNIETIEECMFINCESLKGIIIPNWKDTAMEAI
jgi:hypothetical protein